MADPYSFLTADEPTAAEHSAAMIQALRRQQAQGILGQITGDPVLSKIGGGLMGDAARQEQQLTGMSGARAQRGLELTRLGQRQKEAQMAAERMRRQQAATEQYRNAQLAIARGNLGLKQRQFESGEWKTQNDPATGGIIKFNTRTGETVALGPGGGAPGQTTPGGRAPVGKLTESQATAAFFINQGVNAFNQAAQAQEAGGNILPGTGVKGNIEALGWKAREYTPSLVPQGVQTRQSLLLSLAEPIVRAESGAAVPPEEVKRLALRYIPSPGEPRGEQIRKLEALAGSYRSLQRKAGPQEARNVEPALQKIEAWVEQVKRETAVGGQSRQPAPAPLMPVESYYD
jgi:hypothetical protein